VLVQITTAMNMAATITMASNMNSGKVRSLRGRWLAICVLILLCVTAPLGNAQANPQGQAQGRGMGLDVYVQLQTGMSEGELIMRAGRPDHQSIDNARDAQKSYYYFPTVDHPFLTTVSMRGGRIVNLERIRKNL